VNKLSSYYILYIILLSAYVGVVWLLPYFPTQDGPSHIYNLVILKDLLNGGREWGNYFTYSLHAVPNLGFNLLAYPMLHFFPPLIVEKLFISIYIVLMGVSVPLFLCTFNKTSLPFIYFVFPVIFNYNLLMGFYSYVVTIPLFLIAFSFSWKIRDRSTTCKFVFFNIAGLTIFYFHLIPFVFLLLSLIGITIVQSKGYRRIIIDQLKLLIIISPSLLIMFLYLAKGTISSLPDFSHLFSLSRYIFLWKDLFFFSTVTFSPWQMLPGFTFTFLFLSFLIISVYLSIKDRYKSGIRIGHISSSEKVLVCLSSFLILIYLFIPFRLGGGNFFNQRFPWVILLITLPLLRFHEKILSKRFVVITSVIIAILFSAFNATLLWQQSAKVEKFLSGLNAEIPKGAFVMTYNKSWDDEWSRVDVLKHAASYYGIFKGCVDIGNYETERYYFPIKFKDTIFPIPSPGKIGYEVGTINWQDYPSIQYLLGWKIDKTDTKKLSKFFHIIREEDPFSIWQRNSVNP